MNDIVWFDLVLLYIHPCRLFDVKSCLYIFTNPSDQAGYDTRSMFNRFEFRVFLLRDKLPHSWRENNCIHTFPKSYSAM